MKQNRNHFTVYNITINFVFLNKNIIHFTELHTMFDIVIVYNLKLNNCILGIYNNPEGLTCNLITKTNC